MKKLFILTLLTLLLAVGCADKGETASKAEKDVEVDYKDENAYLQGELEAL